MKKILLFLAHGCGSGQLRPAPGTWGSLAACLIGTVWMYFFGAMSIWFLFLVGGMGIYICDSGEKQLGIHDASEIVFDEWVGMWITMWAVPLAWIPVAFLLFRVLDITKIGPIGKIQDLPGGLGIMADDVLAGILGRVLLAIVLLLVGMF